MENGNVTTTAPDVSDRLPLPEFDFVFASRSGGYFKIWIVNVCLTLLTLGAYSAWAEVRTRRYFYRNVVLDGHITIALTAYDELRFGRYMLMNR